MAKKKRSKRCLIVAEVSANHGRDLRRAVAMIRKAKECGADAVKFQTYTPDTLTIDSDRGFFRVKHPKWKGQTLYQLYGKACTPWEWFAKLKKTADSEGIMFFSTAFDKTSVDLLEKLKVPVHKIASFELVDLPLIRYAAKTGKPMIMSTGMAMKSEIKEAVDAARKAGAKDITLLKCVSSYPADPREMNLLTLRDMRESFGCPVGLSDHSMGIGASVAAVALGAAVIEKHFTLSRKHKTPDSFFSIEPGELRALVENVRVAEMAVGRVHYGLTEDEKKSKVFRRSLFAVGNIGKGEVFTEKNVRSVRPANGLSPKYADAVYGKKAKKNIRKGTPLGWEHIA
jgi:pseudaminic acid synthase